MNKLFKDLMTSDGEKLSLGRLSFCIGFIISMIVYIFAATISTSMVTLLGLLLGYGTLSKIPKLKNGLNSIKNRFQSLPKGGC